MPRTLQPKSYPVAAAQLVVALVLLVTGPSAPSLAAATRALGGAVCGYAGGRYVHVYRDTEKPDGSQYLRAHWRARRYDRSGRPLGLEFSLYAEPANPCNPWFNTNTCDPDDILHNLSVELNEEVECQADGAFAFIWDPRGYDAFANTMLAKFVSASDVQGPTEFVTDRNRHKVFTPRELSNFYSMQGGRSCAVPDGYWNVYHEFDHLFSDGVERTFLRYASLGGFTGPEFLVGEEGPDYQVTDVRTMHCLPNGDVLVFFRLAHPPLYESYSQRFGQSGPVGPRVSLSFTPGWTTLALPDGNLASVVFSDDHGSGAFPVAFQLRSASGDPVGDPVPLGVNREGDHDLYNVTLTSDGQAIFLWEYLKTNPRGQIIAGSITGQALDVASKGLSDEFWVVQWRPRWTDLITLIAGPDGDLRLTGPGFRDEQGPKGYRLRTFDVSPAECPPSPSDGCYSGSSVLAIKGGSSLTWTMTTGATQSIEQVISNHAICIYDYAGGIPTLRGAFSAPATSRCEDKACWRASLRASGESVAFSKDGLKFARSSTTKRDGERAGKVSIKIPPEGIAPLGPVAADRFFLASPQVTMQLVNSRGECWRADYLNPRTNSFSGFVAKE